MADFGWMLYLAMAALLAYFWTQVRGASFDGLLDRMHEEHVRVHKVLKQHPEGGDWASFRRWMRGRV